MSEPKSDSKQVASEFKLPDMLKLAQNMTQVFQRGAEIFGAMAALTHADRSATVRAKTTCSVVKVPKEQFTELIKSNPATIHGLLIDMANSIVNLNEQLVGLQGNRRGHRPEG